MKKILEEVGLEDSDVKKVIAGMKKAKVFTSKEENIDDRYEKLKEQKDELDKQMKERDKQLEEVKKKASGNEDLEKQIQDLQEVNKSTVEENETKLREQEFNHRLDVSLRDSKVKNVKAVKALLDNDMLKIDGGNLQEQIDKLKESDEYLFESVEPKESGSTGNFGKNKVDSSIEKEQFKKLGYKEKVNMKNTNPELYSKLNKKE